MDRETELKSKGYTYNTGYGMDDKAAKQRAAELRQIGYRATVVEYTTSVKGLHHYSVWSKRR